MREAPLVNDTEPMPTVVAGAPAARRPVAFAMAAAWIVALGASFACAYLRGEVVALHAELQTARVAERQARREADRASLDAENARTALANVDAQPTDAPEPADTPDP